MKGARPPVKAAPLFRLLGPMVVEPHGTVVDVKRAKSSALAAYLACNPQRHTRNHLVSLLWPEVNEARGLASLRPPSGSCSACWAEDRLPRRPASSPYPS